MELILGWICLLKKVRIASIFFVGRISRRGGVMEHMGYMKALRLDMVLVDYLDETGSLKMKLDQLSG